VGPIVGDDDGTMVGDTDGCTDGAAVGDAVGSHVVAGMQAQTQTPSVNVEPPSQSSPHFQVM